MNGNRAKIFYTGCLLLGLLVCISMLITLAHYQKSRACFNDRPPLAALTLTVNENQQKQLIEQTQKFASQYGFEFNISYYTPQGNDFNIDMIREDVEIVIGNATALEKFHVYFYVYDCIHTIEAAEVENLSSALKSFLSEIPGVVIVEEK